MHIDDIKPDTRICTPGSLQAPEQVLGHNWSRPADVWAVGCLVRVAIASYDVFRSRILSAQVFHLLAGDDVFPEGWFPYSKENHIARMYDRLGPFPMDFVRRCAHGEQFIGDNGEFETLPLTRVA